MTQGLYDWRQLAVEAEEEAARYPLKAEQKPRVRAAIDAARRWLGGDSVASHAISFKPEPWARVLDALPARCIERGVITRGDVIAVAADKGDEQIECNTSREALVSLLGDALQAGHDENPMAAYYCLRGEHPGPAAAKHWGAAFLTRALYFGLRDETPERSALILDNVMAGQVTKLSDLPHLLYRGRGYNWRSYRYGVYLAWMRQTARVFGVTPELLEYSLFTT